MAHRHLAGDQRGTGLVAVFEDVEQMPGLFHLEVRSLILGDLKKRMLRIADHRFIFVPCGRFAENYH
ncbi:MAG: hypothetical protein C4575_08880 [Desulforudis sp.]|nr:MAG: hypothetical protein C4575_08880 [Desulforudis sp.]